MAVNTLQIGGNVGLRGAAVSTAPGATSFRGLGAIGAGLEDIATVMQEDQEHRDRLKAVEQQGIAERRWTEGVAALDPTADDYLPRVEETFASVRDDIMADPGISSRGVREQLELNLTSRMQHGMLAAVTTRGAAIEDKGLALFDERKDAALAQIRSDPDGYDHFVAGFAGIAEQIGPAVSAPEMAERLRIAGDEAIGAKVEGLADKGRYEEAREFLKAAEGELSPEDSRYFGRRIREIETTKRQDFLSATAKSIADVDIAITDAASTGELDRIRRQIERDPGLWQGREERRASLIQELENKRQRIINGQRDTAEALQQLGSGFGNDTQHDADLAFEALAQQLPEDATPEDVASFTTEFVKRSGWLPTPQRRIIANAERTENPQQLATAAQMDASITDVAPGVDTGAGTRTTMVQGFHAAGLEWGEAAQLVIDRAPDAATAKERGEEFDDEYADQDWREFLRDEGVSPERGFFSPFTPTAEIPAELAAETERVAKLYYQTSGDFDAARKAAVAHLARTYGATNVGGTSRLQKYPPERFLPVGGPEDAELRTRALDGLVRSVVSAAGATVPTPKEGPGHSLVADTRTQREVQSGQRPSYEVRVRSKVGDVMVPVWVETTGGQRVKLRLTVPDATTAAALPEVVEARAASRARVDFREDVSQLAGAAGRAAARGAGAAITAIPKAAGKAGMATIEHHPYQGWMQRRRAERKAREKK